MKSDEQLKESIRKMDRVAAIVCCCLFTTIMVLGFFIPYHIYVGDGVAMSNGWLLYFISIMLVSILSMLFPGMKLIQYFYKKYYGDKK